MIAVANPTKRLGGSVHGPLTRTIRERVVKRDNRRIGRLQIENDGTLFWHPEQPSGVAPGHSFRSVSAFVEAYQAAP